MVRLHDAESIDSIEWPANDLGRRAMAFLSPILTRGVRTYIGNVVTSLQLLQIDDVVLPVTINDAEYGTSYACSMYDFYIRYLITELKFLNIPGLERVIAILLKMIGKLCQAFQINKAVFVNNWMISTNLYPALSEDQLLQIGEFLRHTYPDHLIAFKSLNRRSNQESLDVLLRSGYRALATRRVFILDRGFKTNKRDLRRDERLVQDAEYSVIDKGDICAADIPRLRELYHLLYVEKYSPVNQHYTEEFFRLALATELFELIAVRRNGRIDAFAAYSITDDVMIAPLVGYDTSVPKEVGLYRMVIYLTTQEARRCGVVLNLSAGVASFKRSRGATPHMEYSAIAYSHLPPLRRAFWRVFTEVIDRIGVRLLSLFDL